MFPRVWFFMVMRLKSKVPCDVTSFSASDTKIEEAFDIWKTIVSFNWMFKNIARKYRKL